MTLSRLDKQAANAGIVTSFHKTSDACANVANIVRIVGAASGLGARDQGCALGPDVLRQAGLESALCAQNLVAGWEDIVRRLPVGGRRDTISAIQEFCADIAERVLTVIRHGYRFIVVGGDHACAIGTWSAVSSAIRERGSLGLIWIDAHMDCHTPATSPSGAVHGMPLACLLGYGDLRLTNLVYPGAKLLPEQVCLIGVRSYEEEEAQLLKQLGVRVIFMDEVKRRGLASVIQEAIEIVCWDTVGFGISIDLDAIDPQQAPGVGTPVPGGLDGQELVSCMRLVSQQKGLFGIEIAEYNPLYDPDQKTAHLAIQLLCAGLAKPNEEIYGLRDRIGGSVLRS